MREKMGLQRERMGFLGFLLGSHGFQFKFVGFSGIFVGLLMLLLFLFEFYGFDFSGSKFAGEISLIFPSSNFMRLNCSSCSLRLLFLSCFVFNFCLIL